MKSRGWAACLQWPAYEMAYKLPGPQALPRLWLVTGFGVKCRVDRDYDRDYDVPSIGRTIAIA